MSPRAIALACTGLVLAVTPACARDYLVHDRQGYEAAAAKLQPGDVVRLADGEWKDFAVVFQGQGSAAKPITLTAQTKGKAILTGASMLRLAGSHLVVSGLVFRDGATPGDEVISFRRDARSYASNSRVTEVVVDHFNQSDRRKQDRWVSIYGQDNRVDHSWFAGKGNAGVTLAVIRPKGQPDANRARIDHNYFGPRPPLGSNGGETIRIGTSDESLSDSVSVIENNVFDRCDGETEIISIKSGANIVRNNLVRQSQGAIVLRHGNGNLVERNIFLGGGRPQTGGVRVINERQTVRDNYMEGLAGTDFRSALAVMNGVPGSALSRYHQVTGATIANNSMFDVARVTLGAGADAERSAAPIGSTVRDNLFTSSVPPANSPQSAGALFQVEAAMDGVTFTNNVAGTDAPEALGSGVRRAAVTLKRAGNGLLYPTDPKLAALGAPRDLKPVTLAEVGPSWYAKVADGPDFGYGRTVAVKGDLGNAVAAARPGDVLKLAAGRYKVDAPLSIARPLTLSGPKEAQIAFTAPTLFVLAEGGKLRIEGLTISGRDAPRQPGNAVVRSSPRSTIANYAVELEGTDFAGLDGAPGFDLVATTAGTFADHITLNHVRVAGLSGTVIAAAEEKDKKGLYAAEHVRITDSRFAKIGALADILRGGTDESTFGPDVVISGNQVAGSGPALLTLSGAQATLIADNSFHDAGQIAVAHSVGTPETSILRNRLSGTPEPVVTHLYPQGAPRVTISGNVIGGDAS